MTGFSNLSISTLKQIIPFLVSDKCSKLFISWMEQQFHYQVTITKDNILDVIQWFELQPDLQILEKKNLPAHLGFVEYTCVIVDTHKATVSSNVKYSDNCPNAPGRPSFTNKPPASDRRNNFSNDRKANTKYPRGPDRSRSRTPNS